MRKNPVPKMEVRRAERKDIATLAQMRMALLKEVGNVPSKADVKDLMGAIRRYFHRELRAGRYVGFIGTIRGQAVASGGLAFYARPPYQGNLSGNEAYLMGMYTADRIGVERDSAVECSERSWPLPRLDAWGEFGFIPSRAP